MHYEDMTNEDALKAWDAGDAVWTCEMGGIGPGYEQCIQMMGFEMLRAMMAHPTDWAKMSDDKDAWAKYRAEIEAVPSVKSIIHDMQPSGAQFGGAMNIASVFARHGYAKGMEMVPKDRRILARKQFPQSSQQPAA